MDPRKSRSSRKFQPSVWQFDRSRRACRGKNVREMSVFLRKHEMLLTLLEVTKNDRPRLLSRFEVILNFNAVESTPAPSTRNYDKIPQPFRRFDDPVREHHGFLGIYARGERSYAAEGTYVCEEKRKKNLSPLPRHTCVYAYSCTSAAYIYIYTYTRLYAGRGRRPS